LLIEILRPKAIEQKLVGSALAKASDNDSSVGIQRNGLKLARYRPGHRRGETIVAKASISLRIDAVPRHKCTLHATNRRSTHNDELPIGLHRKSGCRASVPHE
jgi:hypothetical protein